jgi:hypothetical protein
MAFPRPMWLYLSLTVLRPSELLGTNEKMHPSHVDANTVFTAVRLCVFFQQTSGPTHSFRKRPNHITNKLFPLGYLGRWSRILESVFVEPYPTRLYVVTRMRQPTVNYGPVTVIPVVNGAVALCFHSVPVVLHSWVNRILPNINPVPCPSEDFVVFVAPTCTLNKES